MSVTTIYKCDKCGAEQTNPDQFWTVGITAAMSTWQQDGRDFVKGMSLQVCRPCLESFGLYVHKRENKPEPSKPPTLEELIVEIVRNHTNV